MDAWLGYPFGLGLALLWVVGMLRGQATYWLARTVTEQTLRRTHPTHGWRAAVHRWLSSDALDRGRGAVQRYGVAAVPVCYLTVGLQTAVLASAGVMRMRWPRFTIAQAFGALAWATIYATAGFAVWAAFFKAALRGGPGLALLGLAALAVVVGVLVHRRAVSRRRGTPGSVARAVAGRGDAWARPAPPSTSGRGTPGYRAEASDRRPREARRR